MCFVDRIFSTFPEDTNGLCDIYEVAMQQAEEKSVLVWMRDRYN